MKPIGNGWKKVASVTTGGKPYFWFRAGLKLEYYVWNRVDLKWEYRTEPTITL